MPTRTMTRPDFRHFLAIPTRWMDNDIYGHINNVHYHSYFDTAVNQFLIARGVLDIHQGAVVGFVAETACRYYRQTAFPDPVHAGMHVTRLGTSSVRYEVGLFLFRNDEEVVASVGHFVYVYVERVSGKSVPIPPATRQVLAALCV